MSSHPPTGHCDVEEEVQDVDDEEDGACKKESRKDVSSSRSRNKRASE